MSTYKLYYFNGRGHGEISRLIFATVGQKFEYIRYERDQWASHKAKKPLDQVPLLKFDGNKLPQSMSIACFLTKQFNLAGKDNFEQTKVDAVVDTINDTLAIYISIYFEEDAAKQQEVCCNHLTWADLFFYVIADQFFAFDEVFFNNYL
jgi:hypothetical protein